MKCYRDALGPLPSVVKFNKLLTVVTKMKHFTCSLDLFKQMCSLGVPVSKYSMNIAIKCCCQLYRTNDGFAVLGCCFRRAIAPDVFTFSIILNGLVLEDKILEAEKLFKKLIKQKLCEPNVVMYSIMIKGLCKFGNGWKRLLGRCYDLIVVNRSDRSCEIATLQNTSSREEKP
ncbi:hypothetical protein L1987_56481 [Smallanthus sonchifolius]|uniref:Uncharacterized protein n=1 Tax=Smallanthus sonchifolius TaxID=185202 RepID=A0ACB9ECI5_9ASTR|nr:hypothetical protein L1987_56481 [Smallanthus sonchifolius]